MQRTPYFPYDSEWKGFRTISNNLLSNERPGVYLLEHIPTGRCYVGCSGRMRYRPMQLSHKDGEPGKSIREYGREEFGILPLYISLSGRDGLYDAEAALIEAYEAARSGFNVVPSELDRSSGNRLAHSRPHIYAAISDGNRKRNQQESTRRKQAEISTLNWKNIEFRERRMEGHSKPEVRAAMRAAKLGKIKITNEVIERLVSPTEPIPDGWRKGQLPRIRRSHLLTNI